MGKIGRFKLSGGSRPGVVRRLCLASVAIVLFAGIAVDGSAASHRHHHSSRGRSSFNSAQARARQNQQIVQAAQQQLAAARQVLAAAESTGNSAQSKLNEALAKMKIAAADFHEAQSTTRHLAKELNKIEDEIIDQQDDQSPYMKSAQALDAAREKQTKSEEQILAEPAVSSQLANLSGGDLAEKKQDVFKSRADWVMARDGVNAAASEHARIRSELFRNDKEWKAAAQALTAARQEEKHAEGQTHSGASNRTGNFQTVKNASQAAAAARMTIAQAEAIIRSHGGKLPTSNANNNKNQPAKRKN
jgi:chromosome segregation ATPase